MVTARHLPKEIRPVVEEALEQGWDLDRGAKHMLLVKNGERPIAIGSDMSGRALKNATAQIRRAIRAGAPVVQEQEEEPVSTETKNTTIAATRDTQRTMGMLKLGMNIQRIAAKDSSQVEDIVAILRLCANMDLDPAEIAEMIYEEALRR